MNVFDFDAFFTGVTVGKIPVDHVEHEFVRGRIIQRVAVERDEHDLFAVVATEFALLLSDEVRKSEKGHECGCWLLGATSDASGLEKHLKTVRSGQDENDRFRLSLVRRDGERQGQFTVDIQATDGIAERLLNVDQRMRDFVSSHAGLRGVCGILEGFQFEAAGWRGLAGVELLVELQQASVVILFVDEHDRKGKRTKEETGAFRIPVDDGLIEVKRRTIVGTLIVVREICRPG